jgi:hypothetical protein
MSGGYLEQRQVVGSSGVVRRRGYHVTSLSVKRVLNDHVRNVLNVSFGRSQNCLILESLHLLLRADAYIYMYSLLIIRPLLYGRDRTAVAYGRRCSGCRGSAAL